MVGLVCAASTNPEPQQSAAHRRGRPTRGKCPTGRIRIANVGERRGPTHHTLDSQRASIERTARNNGNEIVDVLRDRISLPAAATGRRSPLQRSGFSLATRTRSPGTRKGRARTASTPIPAAWSTATADVDGTSWSPTRNHPRKRSPRSAARSTPPGERSVALALVRAGRLRATAFVGKRSSGRALGRSLLGEGTSEPRVKGGQVRTLAFWESRRGVRDRVLDLRA